MLQTKWKRVCQHLPASQKHFEEISQSISADRQEKWKEEEEEAQRKGGDHLSIYDVWTKEGECDSMGVYI